MLEFPLLNDTSRKIIHIDMDAFFAAVEERDQPALKGKPLVIGADPRKTGGRGVVSTANYAARRFGIHSAMTTKEALERCPQLIFVAGDYQKYRKIGHRIREIFKRYTDLVEPMSIDEAYLDVTDNKLGIGSAIKIARMIQEDIWREEQLTCSAGVSYNKLLAKLASDFQKPAGLTLILPDEAQSFVAQLPVEKIHGVGKRSVERLHQLGIYTGADLQTWSEVDLIDQFGRFGFDLYRKARGINNSPVRPDRVRKSLGSERTYGKLLYEEDDIKAELTKLVQKVTTSLALQHMLGRVIVLKVRYGDFSTLTKRLQLDQASQDQGLIEKKVYHLYDSLEENPIGVRLLGVTLSGLENEGEQQLTIWQAQDLSSTKEKGSKHDIS
ncbi:DNA polymerase IV [Streptococcus sp. DD12]|uniref:DNA polymerase IV n=1 Tax=Streptococcus sp. DD12 TaxID=1777880 RepID=UPI00079354A4|nr:DNA polymerase IV [Streptococcus sp. DD12]KXT75694.1 DNA polymerase IV [Streptococcus sp. DD12]